MAAPTRAGFFGPTMFVLLSFLTLFGFSYANDVLGCGGYIRSDVEISFSRVEIKLFTKQGSLKYQTDCAPNNGYYFIPVEDRGDYVLKIDPPKGWIFEPQEVSLQIDGKNDLCSLNKDINFHFSGFSVVGKVVSRGLKDGPTGVTVSLIDSKGTSIRETLTSDGGGYMFPHVPPGKYQVLADQSRYAFVNARASVEVGLDNGDAGEFLVVAGYDVVGWVLSEGEPITSVSFLLFSDAVDRSKIPDCNKSIPTEFPLGNQKPLCHTLSDRKGKFTFRVLPPGDYKVVPFYKGENIKFDVHPAQQSFQINHDMVELGQKFQVAGFSVSGRVIRNGKNEGVAGAEVLVNGQTVATTDKEGFYYLDSMKTGSYRLSAKADKMKFAQLTAKISPNTPNLPDIMASEFELCGQVMGETGGELPSVSWSPYEGGQTWILDLSSDGSFCTYLPPGKYVLRVPTSEQLRSQGVSFAPLEHIVEIHDLPVAGITFSQFRATVSGTVTCLQECKDVQVILKHKGEGSARKAQAITVSGDGNFTFENILPGVYQLGVVRETWCWEQATRDFTVNLEHITNMDFKQFGYLLTLVTSHDATIQYKLVRGEDAGALSGEFFVNRGTSQECLPRAGVYDLTPRSCHDFGVISSRWDSQKPSPLSLTAHKHLVKGEVASEEEVPDVSIKIHAQSSDRETIIGPITPEVDDNGMYHYKFQYWARAGDVLTATPSAADLLFSPNLQSFTVVNDCMNDAVKIQGRKGLFINGKISPPLAGVTITVVARESEEKLNVFETNDTGEFTAGPLPPEVKYGVVAEKKGFIFTAKKDLGHFEAYKLAEVAMEAVDENGEKLPGVLVTIAGGVDYRQNSLTGPDGTITFSGITPGEYFVRPMMKEFKFVPPSKMVTIQEGETIEIKVSGQRVAWSTVGLVTSLNGEPEPGVVVEAVGKGDCSQYQEEALTEEKGAFRIRGLRSRCEYVVRLKKAPEINQHIERSVPEELTVKVENADTEGLHLYAIRPILIMDITGSVTAAPEHLSTLRVKLFREEVPDSPLHVQKLDQSPFFLLIPLQLDNKSYFIRIESTLNKNQFVYDTPEIAFRTNTSYRHFKFEFKPEPKLVDHEFGQESFLALPLMILLVVMVLNYEKILPFVMQGRDLFYQIVGRGVGSQQGVASETILKKKKPRKL